MGSKVKTPPPRDYYGEMKGAMEAQYRLAPQMMEYERSLIPQWQALQREQMKGQADNLKTFYRDVMGDSANLMTQYGTTFSNAMAPIAQGSRTAYESSLGGGADLQNMMRTQAMSDLSYGSGLTPEMQTQAEQMSRAASSARGLTNTNRGVANEVLTGYKLGQERQDRARTFANTVLGSDVTMAGNAYAQYGSPLIQSGLGALSPMGLATQAMTYNQNLGPTYLQPESQYSANLVSANQNMALQAAVANAQNKNAMITGAMSMFGNMGQGNFFK